MFQKLLLTWAGRPCALTMRVRWGSGPLTVTGILRRGAGTEGWALVPPDEFGGTSCVQITVLALENKPVREVVDGADRRPRLRYWSHPDVTFELEPVDDVETAPQPQLA